MQPDIIWCEQHEISRWKVAEPSHIRETLWQDRRTRFKSESVVTFEAQRLILPRRVERRWAVSRHSGASHQPLINRYYFTYPSVRPLEKRRLIINLFLPFRTGYHLTAHFLFPVASADKQRGKRFIERPTAAAGLQTSSSDSSLPTGSAAVSINNGYLLIRAGNDVFSFFLFTLSIKRRRGSIRLEPVDVRQ